ncbi:MAG: hypothetical protein WBM04_17450 [Candidatus Korobacteraceae bacterium]
MDIKAILMVGGSTSGQEESIGGVSIAYLDVLGMPVIQRVFQRLERFGVSGATIISQVPGEAEPFARRARLHAGLTWKQAPEGQFWQTAENVFSEYVEGGAELVIAVRVGPYVELDYEEMIQHHLDHRCPVTMAVDADGVSLDIFLVSASRRNDAASLFRSELKKLRTECQSFRVSGYSNRLKTAADLRCLAVDGLLLKNSISPQGTEIRPGVWVAKSARVHRKARIVAPAFIGVYSKIRAAALITRGTVVEHHAEIDCGTVVENSTVLPYTYVGAGLDVMHSVVGFHRLSHLVRNVEVEISDRKLVGMPAVGVLSRLAGSTAALFAFLPKEIYRGFFAPSHRRSAADAPECSQQQAAAVNAPVTEAQGSGPEASEFPSTLAVARRYGEQ